MRFMMLLFTRALLSKFGDNARLGALFTVRNVEPFDFFQVIVRDVFPSDFQVTVLDGDAFEFRFLDLVTALWRGRGRGGWFTL